MLVSEAAQLVLQAGAMEKGGEIFFLVHLSRPPDVSPGKFTYGGACQDW